MNRSTLKHSLMASVGIAIFASAATSPVLAQDQDQGDSTIEEILVTARRISESIQDVPGTVTAITRSVIEGAGIQRAEDFIRLTPGVTIVNAAEVGDTQVNIRGINGARDAENSFAFIVDGVLMTNPAAFNREFVDLRQIEIFKGPQGAIYGRNAAAGAIIVTTDQPGNEFRANIRGHFANNDSGYVSASASGPLIQDQLYASVHADWRDTDGHYRNSFLDNRPVVDRFENFNISGRLVWDAPSSDTTLDVKARYGEVDASSITFNAAFALEGFAGAFASPAAFEDVNEHPFVFQPNIISDNNQTAFEISAKLDHDLGWAELTSWFLYSDIDNDLIADGTSGAFGFFASDQACIDSTATLFAGGAGAFSLLPPPQFIGTSPLPILVSNPAFDTNGVPQGSFFGPYTPTTCDGIQEQLRTQSDFSGELRLSSTGDAPLRWQVGTYFLDIDRRVGVSLNRDSGQTPIRGLFQAAGTPNGTEALLFDQFDSTVFAFFGNVQYDVNEDIEISVALRYDNEDRKVTNLVDPTARTTFLDLDGDFLPGDPLNPALLAFPGGIPPQSKTFSEFQPKISATWDASENLTFFASWGKGFKSGGFNNVGSEATINGFINSFIQITDPDFVGPSISDLYRKESSSALEVGFKGNLADNRVRFEGAFYRTIVDDMQFFEFFVGNFGLLRVVSNIDEVEINGFEFGASAQMHEYFTLSGGINFTDSEIKANSSRPTTVGNESPYTADYTANISGDFTYPVSTNLTFRLRADWSFVGDTWFHVIQDQTTQTIFGPLIGLFFCPALGGFTGCDSSLGLGNFSQTKREAYDTVDLRGGFETETWGIFGFVKNLTKEKYLEEVIPAPEFGGSFIHPAALRTWGVELQARF